MQFTGDIIDSLRETFDAEKIQLEFDILAQQSREQFREFHARNMQGGDKIKEEMVRYFETVQEQMTEFSKDVKEWDGNNQQVC